MKGSTLGHIARRAGRSLWENLYLNLVAAGVVGASITLAGVYLTLMVNLSSIVTSWDRDVHVSCYFFTDVPVDRRFTIKDELGRLPEVQEIRYVSEKDARKYLEEQVEDIGPILKELGDDVLPSSLEITLQGGATTPAGIDAFVKKLDYPDFEHVDYGQEWVQRFNTFLDMLKVLGVVFGGLIFTASVFLVGNTMHLVAYARRAELETMKLVGATFGFIVAPFLIEGVVQGLLGAGAALGLVYGVHTLLVQELQGALSLAIAGDQLQFLPWPFQLGLLAAGVVLAELGSLSAVRRFWGNAP